MSHARSQYKQVQVVRRGSTDGMVIVERELEPPRPGHAWVKVQAVPVCQDDIAARVGNRPFLPKLPFVPGYAAVGVVTSAAADVKNVSVSDRVALLCGTGAYSEYICWDATRMMRVPTELDAAQVAPLLLNYLVAYQILHRTLRARRGQTALLVGSSGGVGTAFLQLGRLTGLKMYGLASRSKHKVLSDHGAIPIDYRSEDFVTVLRAAEPAGIDYVFNGMGDEYIRTGRSVLRESGTLVHYGGPESFGAFLRLMLMFIGYGIRPRGRKIAGYGTHTQPLERVHEDWSELFHMLSDGRIQPMIAAKFPLLEAAQANDLLASGSVVGNVVVLSPEMIRDSKS